MPTMTDTAVRRIVREVMRSVGIVKDANTAGAMIALFLPPDLASSIALPGGEPPDQLHLTLVYLGEDASQLNPDDLAALTEALGNFAQDLAPMAGVVSGVGRFNGGTDGPVVYATVDVPGLAAFRQAVAELAAAAGFPGSPDHDFTPHITLAYGDVELPAIETLPVEFDAVTVAVGGELEAYPFADGPGDAGATPAEPTAASIRRKRARLAVARLAPADRIAATDELAREAAGLMVKMADTRGEAVARALAESGVLGEVEVAPFEWLPDLSAVVWETKGEDGVTRLFADDGESVTGMDAYIARRLELEVPFNPHAFAIERSIRSLRRRGLTASGQVAASTRRPSATGAVRKVTIDDTRVEVVKADASLRYTLGVAYPARRERARKDQQDIDAHADYMTADELELAAWRFLANGAKDSGLMHKDGTDGAGKVVESYIYRGPTWKVEDQIVEAGDWLLGVIWGEDAWGQIASGELTGYSMQGYAARDA